MRHIILKPRLKKATLEYIEQDDLINDGIYITFDVMGYNEHNHCEGMFKMVYDVEDAVYIPYREPTAIYKHGGSLDMCVNKNSKYWNMYKIEY